MRVAWFAEIKRGPSVVPTKGASDDPSREYPRGRPLGRGDHCPVLRDRRHLPPPQSQRPALRIPQAALGPGGPHPRAVPTASWCGVLPRLLARSRPLLLPPLPRRGRPCSFLFSSPHPQAQAIPRTLEADRRGGAGRRARNLAHRFDPALGNAPQRGFSIRGLRGRGLGAVGLLQRLWGEASPLV